MSAGPKYRDEEWLREKYIEKRHSAYEIAEICDCVNSTIYTWLEKHGIETRNDGCAENWAPDERLTDSDWLREQYLEQWRSSSEIADECDCSASAVRGWLKRHGIETHAQAGKTAPDKRLTERDWLQEQYGELQRSMKEIARQLECSDSAVANWLDNHGIEKRSCSEQLKTERPDREWLREQYVEEKRSMDEIANELGCGHSILSEWFDDFGIETRSRGAHNIADGQLTDAEWLEEQYIEKQQTTQDIADDCGCSPSTVLRWLKSHDIEPRESGGKPIPDDRLTDAKWLEEQYVIQGRSTKEIADECGCSDVCVADWLRRNEVQLRDPTPEMPDERLADGEWMREQYVEKYRSMYDIADECGCCRSTIRNWLERHGIQTGIKGIRATDHRLADRDWVYEQYVEEERRVREIAKECGCCRSTVIRWVNRHDIETRGKGWLTGEDHPSFNGGTFPYGPGWNDRKKRAVRERDDYTCQDPRCSVTQSEHQEKYGEKLHVHHLRKARDIDDPEERNAKENLITLCRDCHRRWEKIADAGLVPEVQR